MGASAACAMGLVDKAFGEGMTDFQEQVRARASTLARDRGLTLLLQGERRRLQRDEARTPLAAHRAQELSRMWDCFYGPDQAYHEARQRFVHKRPTPVPVEVRP